MFAKTIPFLLCLWLVTGTSAQQQQQQQQQENEEERASFVITNHHYALGNPEKLQSACQDEFGSHARVLNLDHDTTLPLQWSSIAPLFIEFVDHNGDGGRSITAGAGATTLQRFTYYWARASSDYLDRLSSSRGVVVEYLWGDHVEPVLMGDVEMPSFLKVQVLCRITSSSTSTSTTTMDASSDIESEQEEQQEGTIKPFMASSYGHWHIDTWAGDTMDFVNKGKNSGTTCEMILLDSRDFGNVGLQIQARLRSTHMWFYMDAAVVQIGDEKLEVHASEKAGANPYWANGAYQGDLESMFAFDYPVTFYQLNAHQREFTIHLNGKGNVIRIRTFHHYVRVDVQATPDSDLTEGGFGLLGSFPDGQWIGQDYQTMLDNANDFATEWMVGNRHASLFQPAAVADDNGYQKCHFDVVASRKPRLAYDEDDDYYYNVNEENQQHALLPSEIHSIRRRLRATDMSQEQVSVPEAPLTVDDAETACARVHKEHPKRIVFCVEGLMEIIINKEQGRLAVEGAFADVYHALFSHPHGVIVD